MGTTKRMYLFYIFNELNLILETLLNIERKTLKTFFTNNLKSFSARLLGSALVTACFLLAGTSSLQAQTFGPVNCSYYFSNCSSNYFCSAPGFPGCTTADATLTRVQTLFDR